MLCVLKCRSYKSNTFGEKSDEVSGVWGRINCCTREETIMFYSSKTLLLVVFRPTTLVNAHFVLALGNMDINFL